ncbi:MAG: PA0069 family radical SAM protein [Alphaproteobacteria bacterium]|nr:PA0069 family radical SAM protein [Alphaproteobacteria bacterium]
MVDLLPDRPRKGRGAVSNPTGRFEAAVRFAVADGWTEEREPEEAGPLRTRVTIDATRSILTRNNSPDIPFNRSINPYRGCEHGCIYCFARPTHAYLGLSPGLDFESRLFAKPNAPELLAAELRKPGYRCEVLALGMNTDCYQPIERRYEITRKILETLAAFGQPVNLVTKSTLVLRDLDILGEMAARRLVKVFVSVTSLRPEIARTLEPRAPHPKHRIETIRRLAEAGVPAGVMTAPVIPFLTDPEMEKILKTAAKAGAKEAGYVALRLPREVAPLFREWLEANAPGKANHVMSLVQGMRGGKDYDSRFFIRRRGIGNYAELLAKRFKLACRRLGLNEKAIALDCSRFRPPPGVGAQLDLFS